MLRSFSTSHKRSKTKQPKNVLLLVDATWIAVRANKIALNCIPIETTETIESFSAAEVSNFFDDETPDPQTCTSAPSPPFASQQSREWFPAKPLPPSPSISPTCTVCEQPHTVETLALHLFVIHLAGFFRRFKPNGCLLAFDTSTSVDVRRQIDNRYKINRSLQGDLSINTDLLFKFCELARIPTFLTRHGEADDSIASVVRKIRADHLRSDTLLFDNPTPGPPTPALEGPSLERGKGEDLLSIVIVSKDKDFAYLVSDDSPPVSLVSSMKEKLQNAKFVEGKFKVPADQIQYLLALAGDPVDGIKGVGKIGPKKAVKLLHGLEEVSHQAILSQLNPEQQHEFELALMLVNPVADTKVTDLSLQPVDLNSIEPSDFQYSPSVPEKLELFLQRFRCTRALESWKNLQRTSEAEIQSTNGLEQRATKIQAAENLKDLENLENLENLELQKS